MGVIGAAMGVGMVLGPGLGGLVAGGSLSLPFFLASAMGLVSLAMIWFVLPKSLPVEKRSTEGRVQGINLRLVFGALFSPIGFMLFLAFLVNFALASFEGIFGLYASELFNYGPAQVGSTLMFIGLITALVQALLTGPATRHLGEGMVIKIALILSAGGFLLMDWAQTSSQLVVTIGFFVFANVMLRPAIMSLTSKIAPPGQQGQSLGLNNSYQSLGRVAGPLWAGWTFDLNPHYPFISGAVIMFISFLFSLSRLASMPAAQPKPEKAGAD